jgi:hypothetical protein
LSISIPPHPPTTRRLASLSDMSSVPDFGANLLATPGTRGHRHRRSQAISGDFDIVGLGLFSPSSHKPIVASQQQQEQQQQQSNDIEIDKQFTFDNEADFVNKQPNVSFSFPNIKTPDLSKYNGSPRHNTTFSPRCSSCFHPSSASTLNSPIKFAPPNCHRHSKSSSSYPKTRFFATEDTHMFSENVPDAMIDLDEILNVNLQINDSINNTPKDPGSQQQISTTDIFPTDDDFLASPFLKQSNPFVSSSYYNNVNSTPIFENPREERNDSILEEDDDRILNVDEPLGNVDHETGVFGSDEFFLHAPPTSSIIYAINSGNSSTTSIRARPSGNLIEKTLSNSSKDSSCSINIIAQGSITPPLISKKRSGAKANRYQIFYDQSNRISNALKNSSSDSIHLLKSDSNGGLNSKESHVLGHSCSLPSLKTLKRANSYHYPLPRFVELRSHRVGSPPIPSSMSKSLLRESAIVNETAVDEFHLFNDDKSFESDDITRVAVENIEAKVGPEKSLSDPTKSNVTSLIPNIMICPVKPVSTSPISIQSDASGGILSNTTTELTYHSSYPSEGPQENPKHDSSNKISSFEAGNKSIESEGMDAPSIKVGNDNDLTSSTSTDVTIDQDDILENLKLAYTSRIANLGTNVEPKSSIISEKPTPINLQLADFTSSPKISSGQHNPVRRLSPSVETFLDATRIPRYSKPSPRLKEHQTPRRLNKSALRDEINKQDPSKTETNFSKRIPRSYDTDQMSNISRESSILTNDETKGRKSMRKASKFISWFKRK